MMRSVTVFLFLMWVASSSVLWARPLDSSATYRLRLKRASDKIIIDGKLDETSWREADAAKDFFQNFPFDTSLARSKTEAFVTYDDSHLYIAAVCYDDEQEFIVQSLRRDFSFNESDNFSVYIDALNNKTSGFTFRVSPVGAQGEGLIANGDNVSLNWDNKWISETRIEPGKWIAEMAIPFNTLRFNSNGSEWRINFARNNLKQNERSSWIPIPRNFFVLNLAYMGTLVWDEPPKSAGANISLIPYTIGSNSADYLNRNFPNATFNAGGDIKFAVTPSLNLDVTLNPDFSQVDVDRQVTNLDRFSIFFPEQRQFFLENADLFSSFGFSRIRPFFSRQIGLSNGQQIPIIAGARLSGNLDKDWRIGLLNMQTGDKAALNYKGNNYSVAVVQRQVLARSNISAIFVNRQGNNFGGVDGNNFNRVAGLDFNFISDDSRWLGKLFYHHNFTPVSRPSQYATALFLRYDQPEFRLEWNHEFIGQNYNPEVGFVPRKGVWRFEPIGEYRFYPQSDILNNHGLFMRGDVYRSQDFLQTLDRTIEVAYFFNFQNTVETGVFYNDIFTRLTAPFDATGRNRTPLPIGDYNYRLIGGWFSSDIRERFTFGGDAFYGSYFNGSRVQYLARAAYRFQPFGSIGVNLQQNFITLPAPYESATLTLVGTTLDLSLTQNLFITTFLQYNTQIQNMNLNARLQWRFAPMSDVFLVYTDNYDTNVFGIRNRGIVMKVSYWFNV